jgi:stage V sporulation protein B
MANSLMTKKSSEAENAGRGGLFVLGAKAFFVVAGLIQNALLSTVFGMAGYGALSRVLGVANIPNNVVVSTSLQGVSRQTSRAGDAHPDALRDALRVHAPLALFFGGSLALAAPWIARVQYAPEMVTPLVFMSVVLACYGMYAPLVGGLNGRRLFSKQATLDILSATFRTSGLVLGAYFAMRTGYSGVSGACAGAALAALCIFPFALSFSKLRRTSKTTFDMRGYLANLLPIALVQLGTNLLLQVDLFLVGRYLNASAIAHGMSSAEANEWIAIYRACQLFAFLPYQLLMSLTQILFPMVSKAHTEGDHETVSRTVDRGMRLAALATGLLTSVLVAVPGSVLRILYSAEYAERGASTLRVLALGQAAFTLFSVASALLTSVGKERVGARVTLGALALSASALVILLPMQPFGASMVHLSAAIVSTTFLLTLATTAFFVQRATGAFVRSTTIARVLVAAGAVVLVGALLSLLPVPSKRVFAALAGVLICAALGIVYLLALVGVRELSREDLASLRGLRKK